MAETFGKFDAADYLKSDEHIVAYLDDAAQDGDPGAMTSALGTVARTRNVSQLARDTGMTREGIYKALSADGNPGFATVVRVARALGFDVAFQSRAKANFESSSNTVGTVEEVEEAVVARGAKVREEVVIEKVGPARTKVVPGTE